VSTLTLLGKYGSVTVHGSHEWLRLQRWQCARASISQDYWGDIKDLKTGRQKSPSGIQGWSPGRGSGEQSPPEAEAFL